MKVDSELISDDGTRKYVLELDDGNKLESVLLFHKRTITACVSSQVGCAMKCSFCATGKQGFARNLTVDEIVSQVDLMEEKASCKVTNVVFMGMGEPLMNYDNVIKAVHVFGERIGYRRITVSTVGIPDRIKQLADSKCLFALSLHAPNDELRSKLIPVNNAYLIKDIMTACKYLPIKHNKPLMIEYVLLAGINDLPEHAEQLSELLKPFDHVLINLIPYNPVSDLPYKRPSEEAATRFKQKLIDLGYKTIIRTTKGLDSKAACGMLTG